MLTSYSAVNLTVDRKYLMSSATPFDLQSTKVDDILKEKFNKLELHHILYVLLAAHLLAVVYCPELFEPINDPPSVL